MMLNTRVTDRHAISSYGKQRLNSSSQILVRYGWQCISQQLYSLEICVPFGKGLLPNSPHGISDEGWQLEG